MDWINVNEIRISNRFVRHKGVIMNGRQECLERANSIVNGEREDMYGSPEDSFDLVAELWTKYLGTAIDPIDVPIMMILLKIARHSNGIPKEDNFIDIAGYSACAMEIMKPPSDDF